ncbi:MAG: hypothetical protein ACYCPQ_01735 [Elusimicrobiota bacterium]
MNLRRRAIGAFTATLACAPLIVAAQSLQFFPQAPPINAGRQAWVNFLTGMKSAVSREIQSGFKISKKPEQWIIFESEQKTVTAHFPDLNPKIGEIETLLDASRTAPPRELPTGFSKKVAVKIAKAGPDAIGFNRGFSKQSLNQFFDDSSWARAKSYAIGVPALASRSRLQHALPLAPLRQWESHSIPPPYKADRAIAKSNAMGSLLHKISMFMGRPMDSTDQKFSNQFNAALDSVLSRTIAGRKLIAATNKNRPPILLNKASPEIEAYYDSGINAVIFNTVGVAPEIFPGSTAMTKKAENDPDFLARYLLSHPNALRRVADKEAPVFFHEKTHQLQNLDSENCNCIEQEEQAFINSAADYMLETLKRKPKNVYFKIPGRQLQNLIYYADNDRAFKNAIIQAYGRAKLSDSQPLAEKIRTVKKELAGWQGETFIGYYFLKKDLRQDERWNRYYQSYFAQREAQWPSVSFETNILMAERLALGNRDIYMAAKFFSRAAARARAGGVNNPSSRARLQQALNSIASVIPRKQTTYDRQAVRKLRRAARQNKLKMPNSLKNL